MSDGAADHVIDKMNLVIKATEVNIRTARPTGEFHDASELRNVGKALAIGGGLVAKYGPAPQARAAGAGATAVGGGLVIAADLIETIEKVEIKFRDLSEVLDAYRENQRKIAEHAQELRADLNRDGAKLPPYEKAFAEQTVLEGKNEAIISGIAGAWARLARNLGVVKKFPERFADSVEQGIIREIEAVRDALGEILDKADDPKAARLLSRIQDFLVRIAPAAPFFGEGGGPRAGGRVIPRFLGPTSGFSGGSGDDVLFGGAGSDTLGGSLSRLGGDAEAAAQGFIGLNDQVERFEALGGPLATGLAETNTLFGTQVERLRGLGGLLPELGHQLIEVFDSGTVGVENLDRAVAAVGQRFLDAFEGAIRRGESLGDVLKSLARDLANLALNEVKTNGIGGIFDILGELFTGGASTSAASSATSLIWTAKGNAFTNGRLTALAKGGAFTNSIVDRPTLFPMASGAGLMGEAGPEAVLPLTRLANGELGVKTPAPAAVAAGPVIVYNIDARGADREGMNRLVAVVRNQGARINYIDKTLERRAVEAMVYTRGRGGNIARAFGGW